MQIMFLHLSGTQKLRFTYFNFNNLSLSKNHDANDVANITNLIVSSFSQSERLLANNRWQNNLKQIFDKLNDMWTMRTPTIAKMCWSLNLINLSLYRTRKQTSFYKDRFLQFLSITENEVWRNHGVPHWSTLQSTFGVLDLFEYLKVYWIAILYICPRGQ